jgi:hypothetical protein
VTSGNTLASTARAQNVELFGGYSFLETTGMNYERAATNGWNAAVSANFKSRGVVTDFSNHCGAMKSPRIAIGVVFTFGKR